MRPTRLLEDSNCTAASHVMPMLIPRIWFRHKDFVFFSRIVSHMVVFVDYYEHKQSRRRVRMSVRQVVNITPTVSSEATVLRRADTIATEALFVVIRFFFYVTRLKSLLHVSVCYLSCVMTPC